MSTPARVELLAVPGMPEVAPGDDLAALVLTALDGAGLALGAGDVLAVASKVVAKAEGRYLAAPAGGVAHESVVAGETMRVVAQRRTLRGLARIVRSWSGPVLAAAGVDASNLPGPDLLLALPADPDASARRLRAALRTALHAAQQEARAPSAPLVGVLVTDTLGRPWRLGQTDAAIGAAGLLVAEDLSGRPDAHGRVMEVTLRALADEIAAAADLVKGKVDGVPVAVVRGLGHLVTADDGPGAGALLRDADEDWFRYGHAEAARAALGLDPETLAAAGVDVQPVSPGSAWERLERAVAVALAAPGFGAGSDDPATRTAKTPGAGLHVDPHAEFAVGVSIRCPPTPAGWLAAGALAQRIVVAAWAEGLAVRAYCPTADQVVVGQPTSHEPPQPGGGGCGLRAVVDDDPLPSG